MADARPTPPVSAGTVLVVDDSLTMRNALRKVLEGEHRVLLASNGHEALALAVEEQPDLVILDGVMPGMDGYAVCARLKSDPRTEDLPVLFLTGLDSEADETLALEAGAIDFITKPFRPRVVAARIRNHMELKRLRDHLRDLSLVDGLTGIANRRRFDRSLRQAWATAQHERRSLAVILGDVDYFKRYNDAYGHQAGDACLQAVARAFSQALPGRSDLAARYGGEEFVALLPEADQARAATVAERIRAEVRALNLPHAQSDVSELVTVSLGWATARPSEGGTPEALLLRADEKLYEAKRSGRDRVCG